MTWTGKKGIGFFSQALVAPDPGNSQAKPLSEDDPPQEW